MQEAKLDFFSIISQAVLLILKLINFNLYWVALFCMRVLLLKRVGPTSNICVTGGSLTCV